MRTLLLISLIFNSVCCIDVMIKTLQETVDWDSNPCDNFYRHVCPIGSPSSPLYDNIGKTLSQPGYAAVVKYLPVFKFSNSLNLSDFDFSQYVAELYRKRCKNGLKNTNLLEVLRNMTSSSNFCNGPYCDSHFEKDSDCDRVAAVTRNIFTASSGSIGMHIHGIRGYIRNTAIKFSDLYFAVNNNLEDAFDRTNEILEELKIVADNMILETPWALNNNVSESILTAMQSTSMKLDYGKMMTESLEQLLTLDSNFNECLDILDNDKDAALLCLALIPIEDGFNIMSFFWNFPNAMNMFPNLGISSLYHYMSKHVEEMSARLGSVGFIVGHELSHTLIGSQNEDILTYFSENASSCIQKQYQKTCDHFVETSCAIVDSQLDDNGADMLGLQLAYKYLENFYGDSIKELYTPLNVTHQQLFFYSLAISTCNGTKGEIEYDLFNKIDNHAPWYIRTNAVVNHPAFGEAFNCSADSRMMKSATEECIIYGQGAPESKRR